MSELRDKSQVEFTPGNPRFREVVRESFARQRFMATLGASLALIEPGEVHIELPYSPANTQQNGFLHAGVITSIADSACGYAAFSLSPPGYDILSVEFKINFLAPARAQRFVACGRVVHPGRTLSTVKAEVFGVSDAGRDLVATMIATMITRPSAEGDTTRN